MLEKSSWDAIASDWADEQPHRTWRSIHNRVNADLVRRWWGTVSSARRLLKTDLFDEMSSDGLLGSHVLLADAFGADCSFRVAKTAVDRVEGFRAVVADARHQPFARGAFDLVLSNSTLDHFDTYAEVEAALVELKRLLRDDGELLLTMDNKTNPVVALRNGLPFPWLRKIGLLPYPVGATAGVRKLSRSLVACGFEVIETCTVGHFPRILGVWLAGLSDRLGWRWLGQVTERIVVLAEVLDRLPTRHLTGYFVALRARARSSQENVL